MTVLRIKFCSYEKKSELKIKSTFRYHCIYLLEWQKLKNQKTLTVGRNGEQKELSFMASGDIKWYSCFGRQFGHFYKVCILLPYYPEIKVPSVYPTYLKTHAHTKTCMWLFIVFLLIISKNCKIYFNCVRIEKLVYPHNGTLFSNKKRMKAWTDIDEGTAVKAVETH